MEDSEIRDSDSGSSNSNISLDKQREEPVADDESYCLLGSFVYIQVHKTLFRVPTYRFTEESHVFAGMFNLPQADDDNVEGSTRDNPIVLPDNITSDDFRSFMKVLYPKMLSSKLALGKEEWLSVLRLSTFWYFLNYRKLAITELDAMKAYGPVERIQYGREFKIKQWVSSGMCDVIRRDGTITPEDASMVGYETALALFRIREKDRYNGVEGLVESAFREELATLVQYEEEFNTVEVLPPPDVGPKACQCKEVATVSKKKKKVKHRREDL